MEKDKIWSIPYMVYQDKFQIDQRFKYLKQWIHTNIERKYG